MLTKDENELLTRVGPGTPMGDVLRRYWIPALLADEVEAEGPPVRVKLLGEELVAFRDTQGRVGLLDEFCTHRGASLVYARNEDCGLRCIYHGWKYDVSGTVLETPNEAGARPFEGRLKLTAYPTHEACGVVWAYMGPPERMPAFPEFPWNVKTNVHAKKVLLDCNYLQSIEGGVDSSHVTFLHRSGITVNHGDIIMRDLAPRFELQDMPYGFRYAALRQAGDGQQYVRITPFIMPWYTIVPFQKEMTQAAHGWVPIDDEHNWAFTFNFTIEDGPLPPEKWTHLYEMGGRFTKARTRANNHLQDRAAMKVDSWAGIPLIPDQDAGIQESMKPIFDRTREHLGRADLAVVHMRATMLESIKAVQRGGDPIGIRGEFPASEIQCVVEVHPADVDWRSLGLPKEAVVAS
jgi:phenylpropionate dioxygenase-like ring-hydroxylating dioxygenase large terminal subunit